VYLDVNNVTREITSHPVVMQSRCSYTAAHPEWRLKDLGPESSRFVVISSASSVVPGENVQRESEFFEESTIREQTTNCNVTYVYDEDHVI